MLQVVGQVEQEELSKPSCHHFVAKFSYHGFTRYNYFENL